jgi:hypothetical protein
MWLTAVAAAAVPCDMKGCLVPSPQLWPGIVAQLPALLPLCGTAAAAALCVCVCVLAQVLAAGPALCLMSWTVLLGVLRTTALLQHW